MILIVDIADFARDGDPLHYDTPGMQRAIADAVSHSAKVLEGDSLVDVVVTLRGLILSVVRRGLEGETQVTNFAPVART